MSKHTPEEAVELWNRHTEAELASLRLRLRKMSEQEEITALKENSDEG